MEKEAIAMGKHARMLIPALGLFLWQACAARGGLRPPAPGPSVDRVIQEMERVRQGIEDLLVQVEIVTPDSVSGKQEITRMEFKFKPPDKLVSEVQKPCRRVTVINGENMWIYSPDINVVEKYLLREERKRAQVLYEMSWGLTSPIRMLVRRMNRELIVLKDGTYLITLLPDQKDPDLEMLQVWVDPETWLVGRMKIFAAGRPPTEVMVKHWEANSGLSDEVFDFRVPSGADVFEALE